MKQGWIVLFCLLIPRLSMHSQQGAETAFSKSYTFEYETEYGKAISALQELRAESYPIDLRLGWLYYLNKDYARSESYYRKAIALEPMSVEARFGLALPLSSMGHMNQVLGIYQEILKIDPNNSIANYRSASLYFARKELTNASACIGKVIRMYPFDFDSNLLYAKILLAQNRQAEAKNYLEKAQQYNPQSEEVKNALKQIK